MKQKNHQKGSSFKANLNPKIPRIKSKQIQNLDMQKKYVRIQDNSEEKGIVQ